MVLLRRTRRVSGCIRHSRRVYGDKAGSAPINLHGIIAFDCMEYSVPEKAGVNSRGRSKLIGNLESPVQLPWRFTIPESVGLKGPRKSRHGISSVSVFIALMSYWQSLIDKIGSISTQGRSAGPRWGRRGAVGEHCLSGPLLARELRSRRSVRASQGSFGACAETVTSGVAFSWLLLLARQKK